MHGSVMQEQLRQEFRPNMKLAVVLNETHCSEFVHEVSNSRPRCSHHFRERFVTQHQDLRVRESVLIA